jgi:nucleotide-binding universal stress UspA family protein
MNGMDNILVAYDASVAAEKGLSQALQEAKAHESKVHVITSADRTKTEEDLPNVDVAEDGLRKAQSMFDNERIPCFTHLLIRGLAPGEDIVQYANDNAVDLIIIGVEKQSKVAKFVMGSTAQYVILKAPCPVLSVKA